jgi:hypothetical protein
MANVITEELSRQVASGTDETKLGTIARIASTYTLDSERLVGLLLKLDFAESHIVTCDPWKRTCGGVPRGSFVLFRIDPRAVDPDDSDLCNRLMIARITDAVPTPVEGNIQQTLFQVHKLQAQLDPLTNKDLQWGALKASIVGTYYDDEKGEIAFGNDVDMFLSAFAYAAYAPTDRDVHTLINAFVDRSRAAKIGRLRYTETLPRKVSQPVAIEIDPKDIVGEPNAAQRLANFGKTRFGKSNSTKIIARAIFDSGLNVAQVFFDPSGEYTYPTDQDGGTSLYALYNRRAVRYALAPKPLREDEKKLGLSAPQPLAINFFEFPDVGHELIVSLWATENDAPPLYLRPVLDWAPGTAPRPGNSSAVNHYWRTMGMWYAVLHRASFAVPNNITAPIDFPGPVKQSLLLNVPGVRTTTTGDFDTDGQPVTVLPAIYQHVYRLWQQDQAQSGASGSRRRTTSQPPTSGSASGPSALNFPSSTRTGEPYFNEAETALLRILGDNTIGGARYIRPFNKYHNTRGRSIFSEVATHIENGTSVFIDMSQANEIVRNNLVDRICRAIYKLQNQRFVSEEGVGERFVMLHFEEAHRLFRSDDKDMNSIYNLLAKEGAKLNIAMVYSTQSMTTMSPDLIKNTDNFLIAHLDDDREAREVARKYAFRDVAEDVQRIQSKGYVRMITRSHRFALPVQIDLFAAQSAAS